MSGFAALNSNPSLPVVDHRSKIVGVFAQNQSLASKINRFLKEYPDTVPLFQDIASYISSLQSSQLDAQNASVSKKRKLDGSAAETNTTSANQWTDQSVRPDFVVPDVSFSIPQRKKLRLEGGASKNGGLRAIGADGAIEFSISWDSVDHAFCLPVPEKAKKQHNFVIIPRGGDGLSTAPGAPESIVWTIAESPPTEEGKTDAEPAKTARFLSAQLARFDREVVLPDENEFSSAMPTLKKDDKAYHVKAHRGSKDGYLFFLPPGILWAFKKPLLFLPFSAITSISYTSVLQRTFNLNVTASFTTTDESSKDQEVEFSMIDQTDYAGIHAYVKRHGLNDASLAAERRAKVYNVNKAKQAAAEDANGHETGGAATAEGDDGETELQKAERLLQDEEDEAEEDYVDDESDAGSSDEDYGEGAYGDADDMNGEGAFEEAEDYGDEEGGYGDEADEE